LAHNYKSLKNSLIAFLCILHHFFIQVKPEKKLKTK